MVETKPFGKELINAIEKSKKTCSKCKTKDSLYWYKVEGKWLCFACYNNLENEITI